MAKSSFIAQIKRGEVSEADLCQFIRQFLLTEAQQAQLTALKIDIADVLNGRFPGSAETIIQTMFANWNSNLSEPVFKL